MEKNLLKAYFLAFSLAFLFFISWFFFSIWFTEIGLSGLEIGIVFAVFSMTSLFLLFPVGLINDRVTVKNTMAVGFALLAIASILLSTANSFLGVLPWFFLLGIGSSLSVNSVVNFFFKTKSGKEGAKYGGYVGVRSIGIAFGILLGGFSIFLFDFRLTLLAMGFLFFALAIIAFSLREMPVFTFSVECYKKDFLRKEVLIFALLLFLWATHWGAEETSYFPFLGDSLGLNTMQIGMFAAPTILVLALSSFWAGKKVDSGFDFKKLFLAGLILAGIGHIAMSYPFLPSSFLFRVVHEIGDGIMLFGMMFWTAKLFPIERIGGNAMLVLTVTTLGEMVGAIIFGTMGGMFGYSWPLIISGIISLIAAVIFLFAKKWY